MTRRLSNVLLASLAVAAIAPATIAVAKLTNPQRGALAATVIFWL